MGATTIFLSCKPYLVAFRRKWLLTRNMMSFKLSNIDQVREQTYTVTVEGTGKNITSRLGLELATLSTTQC